MHKQMNFASPACTYLCPLYTCCN